MGWPRKTARRMREPARRSSGRHTDAADDRGDGTVLLPPPLLPPLMPVPVPVPALITAVDVWIRVRSGGFS